MEIEPHPPHSGMPIINEEVKKSLLADLNLDVDPVSQRIVSEISGENPNSPIQRSNDLVKEVFGDLLVTNPSFATGTLTTLKENEYFFNYKIDSFTIGMAVVISAFDKMSDQSLTEKFNRLSEEDIAGALSDLRTAATLSAREASILEQLINIKRIPEQQINLNEVVNTLSKRVLYAGLEVRMGAGVMFGILSKNWDKLMGYNNLPPTSLE